MTTNSISVIIEKYHLFDTSNSNMSRDVTGKPQILKQNMVNSEKTLVAKVTSSVTENVLSFQYVATQEPGTHIK